MSWTNAELDEAYKTGGQEGLEKVIRERLQTSRELQSPPVTSQDSSMGTDLASYGYPLHEDQVSTTTLQVKSKSRDQALADAQWSAVALLVGLALGIIIFLILRPKGKSKNLWQMARRWMAWGLMGSMIMGTANAWHAGDLNGFIKATIGVSLNGAIAWLLGLGFGWVKFSVIERRKKEGPSGVALSSEELSALMESASNGDIKSQYQLALCYLHGQGVVKNTVEAYKWVLLAQAGGLLEARRLCDKIEKILSRTEIAHGQHMASEFRKFGY